MRPRQIAPVALVLALTVAGFAGTRALGERDARRDSEHRAEVDAAQIHGRVEHGASLTESLRRFMVSAAGQGLTGAGFESNASRWLSPAGFPAAAWVEQVPASRRAAYERRIGAPIVTRDKRGRILPVGSRSSYLPATLVSGIPPMAVPGIDLGGEPRVAAALTRASTLDHAGATPLVSLGDGTKGLFLIRSAPRLTGGVVVPGFAVVFVSEKWLRAAATDTATLQLTAGGTPTEEHGGAALVHKTFTEAGQRFDVAVPRRSVEGAAAVLPWIILAAGLVLAALASALGVNAARRVRAQNELDRVFTLSSDLITVADFDGHFTRVNPAAEEVLGYSEEELLARPYLDLVHPDDRERTAAEAATLSQGRTTLSFENRYVRKDGSHRVLEWTSTPVVEDRLIYALARDVTERREAEAELERLAGEQAALRRVATLVARQSSAAEVFAAVAEEVGRLLPVEDTAMLRYEDDGTATVVASWGTRGGDFEVGRRITVEGGNITALVHGTGRSARIDNYSEATGSIGVREADTFSAAGVPIVVDGRLWGVMVAAQDMAKPLPAATESRVAEFTELIATAISNIETRSDLAASRARIVATTDQTRRRFERDLHDGVQQRLVSLSLVLRNAETTIPPDLEESRTQLSRVGEELTGVLQDLRELSRGIHPAILSEGGLGPALKALARRSAVPVKLDVRVDGRLEERVEVTAYYVVSEGLANAVKHAQASVVEIRVEARDGMLGLAIVDDGVGGADLGRGSGLIGLADRVEALGGTIAIESPAARGTSLHVELPVEAGARSG